MNFLFRSSSKPHPYHRQSRWSSSDAVVQLVRDRGLEHAVEKERNLKPMFNIKNLIKSEPSKSLPISVIAENRQALGLWTRPIDFIRRFPSIFEEFLPGGKGIQPHVRLTAEVLSLDGEESCILQSESYRKQAADRLLKLLMLSRINKIPLSIVDRLKWDLGLPADYVETLLPEFPDYFQVTSAVGRCSGSQEMRVLELVCWSNELAVSILEKNAMTAERGFQKGMPLAFPLHFSKGFEMDKTMKKCVDEWQKLAYMSPYEHALHLPPKSDESDKWAVGLLHELLHLFVPKKTDKENIFCLGEYMGLRSRFKRALVNHPGIFYLSTKTGMHTVLLKEAYKRDLLVEKHPLMEMRYQYIHLMNTVKEDHKPITAPSTVTPKKEQKKASDARKEKIEQFEGSESGEEHGGKLDSDDEEESDDDYDDEDDETENHRDVRQNAALNRRTGKVNFEARGPLRNTGRESSGQRQPSMREGIRRGTREGLNVDTREGHHPGTREGFRADTRGVLRCGTREGLSTAKRVKLHNPKREGPHAGKRDRLPAARREWLPTPKREGPHIGKRDGLPAAWREWPHTGKRDGLPAARRERLPTPNREGPYVGKRDGLRTSKREGKVFPKLSERSEIYNSNNARAQSSEPNYNRNAAKREGRVSSKFAKRAGMYNSDNVHRRSSEKPNFTRRGRSLEDKTTSIQ